MENIKNMFLGVVVCLLFFTVQSSQDAPGNVTIFPRYDIFYTKRNEKPLHNITCEADCLPKCTYMWYIGSNYFTTGNSLFATMSYNYNGSYIFQCRASNDIGNITSRWITVESKDGPDNVTITSSSLEKEKEYIHFQLTCSADCFYRCWNFQWYHNGILNNQSTRILTFDSLSKEDSGDYLCRVSDDFGMTDSGVFTVKVHYGPKNVTIKYSSKYKHLIEGLDYINLTCNADCNPECSYRFNHNRRLLNNGYIDELVHRNMSGQYTCSAKNRIVDVYRDSSNFQDINIRYGPETVKILINNRNISSEISEKEDNSMKTHLRCSSSCNPPCKIAWYRDGQLDPRNSQVILIRRNQEMSGVYQCEASGVKGEVKSDPVQVSFLNGPDNVRIIPSSSNKEKNTFTLTCSASCYHECQSYRWYYNGRWQDQRTPILTFKSLSKEDIGTYLCRVTDDFGYKDASYNINVLYGPKNVTIQYSSWYDQFIEGHGNITLICSADCNPDCSYRFYHNRRLLNKRYIDEPVHRNMSGQYTCSAENSVVDKYRDSSNLVDININYKPTITSSKNQTTITAPDLLDLTFSVDSFPSSNVTIFHETKCLTFIPNMTGQLSFNVSVESCLDQGEYKVVARNNAGLDSFLFFVNVKCPPVILGFSNVSDKGFQVGDSLNLSVTFLANPDAEVLWTLVDWISKNIQKIKESKIQNNTECTMVKINKLNLINFGRYKLELKNYLGKKTQEFYVRGPPQRPTDLNVDCPGSALISWRPGFDGGVTQDFIIEYSNNSSYWQIHRPQSVVPVDNNFISAHINDIRPNIPYSFRIRANNSFGFAESDTTVNCTRQNIDEMASFIDNTNALAGIGVLVFLLLITTAALITVLKLKRKRESNNQDNSLRKQGNNSNEEDNASEIVENILYISADDAKEQIQAARATTQNLQNGSDVYAVVEKKPKTCESDDQPVYTDVCKSDQKKKKPAIAAKPSKVKNDEQPTVNKDGLIYVDLELKDTPSTSTRAFVIHGADDRTMYDDIDFTRRADPNPDTENEKCQNEKGKEKA